MSDNVKDVRDDQKSTRKTDEHNIQRIQSIIDPSITNETFKISSLGEATIPNPIEIAPDARFISDEEFMLLRPIMYNEQELSRPSDEVIRFEVAGPREKIYFPPKRTKVAIVTCGGLCPGLNAVIRGVVMQLYHRYGVENIIGIPYGYQGLGAESTQDFIDLNPEVVQDIHEKGGTIIGSSRGTPPTSEIVDTLEKYNINILFTIGGDGTLRGASKIEEELRKRNLKVSVIGIPKTIDNDIPYVKQSFGFESAVAKACEAVIAAHEEAKGAQRGIGLVKVMGRNSGYIAANAAIGSGLANYCLIPESSFQLEGERGLLKVLEDRMDVKDHAVIIVAEGAGQYFFGGNAIKRDASGNVRFGDIGLFLKDKIIEYFEKVGKPVSLKYIDPSYIIRSTPANVTDRMFCVTLAQNAVHAAMAGKTGMLIGYWHGVLTHIPFKALAGRSQTVNINGQMWFKVLQTTGQPYFI